MDAARRDVFEKCFNNLVAQRMAVTLQDKLALVEELRQAAVEQGAVPISPHEFARVNPKSAHALAIQAGEEISLGGVSIQGQPDLRSRLTGLSNTKKMLLLLCIPAAIVLLFLLMNGAMNRTAEVSPTPTATATVTATITLTPSATPLPLAAATSYAMVLSTAQVPKGVNDPISVEFGGLAFVLYESDLDGGEWRPLVAEWLSGTQLRRVVAVPYSAEVGNAVARLAYGDPIKLRLVSGEVVEYRLTAIQRVKRHQIEVLTERIPSLTIILFGERSTDRYVLIGEAVQPVVSATPTPSPVPTETASPTVSSTTDPNATPSVTPSPTVTASVTPSPTLVPSTTPVFAFTPPSPVTVVITSTWSLDNTAAGLHLEIAACDRVAQIGSTRGYYMVCTMTLTALRPGVSYSGQALAITEFSQVENATSDWWPPVLAIVGALGDGILAGQGETVSGKAAGQVAKPGLNAEPVLLWEQDGIRYIIYLEK